MLSLTIFSRNQDRVFLKEDHEQLANRFGLESHSISHIIHFFCTEKRCLRNREYKVSQIFQRLIFKQLHAKDKYIFFLARGLFGLELAEQQVSYFAWEVFEVNIFLFVENATVIKADLVVSTSNYFVFECGEFFQKGKKFNKIFFYAVVCKISSVNEDVALHSGCYFIKLVILSMGVRDNNYLQFASCCFLFFQCFDAFVFLLA